MSFAWLCRCFSMGMFVCRTLWLWLKLMLTVLLTAAHGPYYASRSTMQVNMSSWASTTSWTFSDLDRHAHALSLSGGHCNPARKVKRWTWETCIRLCLDMGVTMDVQNFHWCQCELRFEQATNGAKVSRWRIAQGILEKKTRAVCGSLLLVSDTTRPWVWSFRIKVAQTLKACTSGCSSFATEKIRDRVLPPL